MEMLLLPFHLILILIITSSSSSYLQPVTASTKHENSTDLEALINFRAHADPYGVLAANWSSKTSFCSWIGVYCSSRRRRVTAIRLANVTLQGTISPHLGNLSFLSHLYLSNNSLSGPIPESIGYLRRLTLIVLQRNSLTGPVPSSIFNMSSLLSFYVATNSLSGSSLPSNNNSFPMPPRLARISLADNLLTGDPLKSILQCRDVQLISLSQNLFSGSMPAEIDTLSKLSILLLGWNQLTGTIPSSLGNLTDLAVLQLHGNNFSGMIPEELGNLVHLRYLDLAQNGNMVGSIPTSLLNLSMLNVFDLSENELSGSLPGGLGNSLSMLERFHVGSNQLSGGLEFLSSLSNCKKLKYLYIYNNALEGVLPDDVGNLSANVLYFKAFGNRIKGNIPNTLEGMFIPSSYEVSNLLICFG